MLSRVDQVTQSLQDYFRSFLDSNGYSGLYVFTDSFPGDRRAPLDKTIVVLAHDSSNPVRDGEVGGPLAIESVTYHFDVLGSTARFGDNIASILKEKLECGERIPLYDYSSSSPVVSDYIAYVDGVVHTSVRLADPVPSLEHWNVVTFSVELTYNRSAL